MLTIVRNMGLHDLLMFTFILLVLFASIVVLVLDIIHAQYGPASMPLLTGMSTGACVYVVIRKLLRLRRGKQ